MNLKKCPLQYRRIINKFIISLGPNKTFQKNDAMTYLEDLSKKKSLSQENFRLHASSLMWFYKKILGINLKIKVPYRKRPIPGTLSLNEVQDILKELPARYLLLFQFMYGLGMKIGEVLSLRMKDVDINNGKIFLSGGRELKIPMYLFESVQKKYKARQKRYIQDRKNNNCFIPIRARGISTDFLDQPFFASRKRTTLKGHDLIGRQFVDPSTLHVFLSSVQEKLALHKRVTSMTFRHSFALYQLEKDCNEVVLKEYLGHSDIRQTLNYKRLLRKAFFTPYEMLQDDISTEQMKELNVLQRYPSDIGLKQFLQKASKAKDGKIKIATKEQQWSEWKYKANEKKLDYSEVINESQSHYHDYCFLDLRKLTGCRPIKTIRTIQALLSASRKKLLIYESELELSSNST